MYEVKHKGCIFQGERKFCSVRLEPPYLLDCNNTRCSAARSLGSRCEGKLVGQYICNLEKSVIIWVGKIGYANPVTCSKTIIYPAAAGIRASDSGVRTGVIDQFACRNIYWRSRSLPISHISSNIILQVIHRNRDTYSQISSMGGRTGIGGNNIIRIRVYIDIALGIYNRIITYCGNGSIVDIRGGTCSGESQESFCGTSSCREIN